ncbi:hypothetical protein FACHB389_35175 [Nostoc calcicola FACHB-389]|nr:hypothetical protein FACHB389_35175 [Nostoc calcicola FACHB-389]
MTAASNTTGKLASSPRRDIMIHASLALVRVEVVLVTEPLTLLPGRIDYQTYKIVTPVNSS